MSLMQLLTNGKTLVDLKNSTSRYHMPGKSFLPKFGPAKNPFTTTPSRPAVVAPVATPEIKAPVEKISPASLKETQRMPEVAKKMKETKRLPFVATRNSAQPQTPELKWWEKFLDWAGAVPAQLAGWWATKKSPVKSAIPRFDKPPVVQGELSLENIKVVRNDLSDADMDVVPARTFTGETNFKPALAPQESGVLAMPERSMALLEK